MPSPPAVLSAGTVPNSITASTNIDSTFVGPADSGGILSNSRLDDAHSTSKDPGALARNTSEPDINGLSEYKATDEKNSEHTEVKQDNGKDGKDDNGSKKSLRIKLRLKQDRRPSTSAQSSRKRKADTSDKKAPKSGLAPPAKKKQKVNKPTAKRQRNASNPKPKTAKEKFLAASAEDTRPAPWGQPEVWAEV